MFFDGIRCLEEPCTILARQVMYHALAAVWCFCKLHARLFDAVEFTWYLYYIAPAWPRLQIRRPRRKIQLGLHDQQSDAQLETVAEPSLHKRLRAKQRCAHYMLFATEMSNVT